MCPEWKKVKTYDQLLETRILNKALIACCEAVVEKVEEITSEQDHYANSCEMGVQQMHYISLSIEPGTDLSAFITYHDEIPACCAVAFKKGLDLAVVHARYRDDILHCLVRERHWLEMFDEGCIKVFGITCEEIVAAQDAYWKPLEAEKQRLQNLLA